MMIMMVVAVVAVMVCVCVWGGGVTPLLLSSTSFGANGFDSCADRPSLHCSWPQPRGA
jgi:hypothetical protein